MTRLGLISNAALGTVLAATLVWAELDRRDEPWRVHQLRYSELLHELGDSEAVRDFAEHGLRPHQIEIERFRALDRCTTCHLGLEPGARALDDRPFRAHPDGDLGMSKTLRELHPLAEFGCSSCHGGQGRMLRPDRAHDRRHAQGGPSAFTHPRDRCSRCHAQGGRRSKRGQRGAEVYLAQGCAGCHQPGRAGPGIGPDLASVGLRGRNYLERVLLRPDEVYPETIMPPLRFVLEEGGDDLESLLALLQGFEPWPSGRENARRPRSFDPRLCTNCHRLGERSWPPVGDKHACPYLESESAWLRCDRCHGHREADPSEIPIPTALSNLQAETADRDGGAQAQATAPVARAPATPDAAPPGDVGTATDEAIRTLPPPPPLELRSSTGACPFLETSFSVCGVCHREGER